MKPGNDLLPLARDLIAQGRLAQAGHCLQALLRLQPTHLEAHNLLETHRLDGNFTDAFGIESRISPDDDIFRFFANHPSCTNPIRDYLSDGWRTMVELGRLLESLDRPLGRCGSFLEFASGFGRFSRHLAKALPEGALHVSDVVPGSVDFLKQHLGVDGFYSVSDPGKLTPPRKYEVIFVLSLFSHLPESTWSTWLARLYDTLEDKGILIITTHGEKCARLMGVSFPPNGFLFIPSSESKALPGEEYGSTFTSTDYVRQAISHHLRDAAIHEFPAHFWGNQDGFAIVKGRQA
ncbi:bifunctional 2-polyprenyl-6-hydroxyphenol methylase/3-demethylubiquinol 3-O-methyltransferase UbiG [Zoogloea sp.]|uniref:class I SAM-dependent methyltransferase n=1 Tax=Zoogloea sp. TaxID=49181 RepID=UPI001DEF19D5|nr:class I SAM-dependent methyltransferase [Zoogloea sp.]MBK6653044.1 methyltransferase domain-containing protein [Zoogloea sp.]